MNEANLRRFLSAVGVTVNRKTRKGWLEFRCPLAPFTHQRGTDGTASAGALIKDHGISSFTCKACGHHGRISKLINLLATYRRNDALRPLIRLSDEADVTDLLSIDFGAFETRIDTDPPPEPLVEEAYEGLFPAAWDVECARAYLQRRSISEDTSRSLGLLYRDRYVRESSYGNGTHEWFRHDILFPVRDRLGRLYGWSGRTTLPDMTPKVFDENLPKRSLILGAERWTPGKPLLLEEGLFGYAHLVNIGAEAVCNVGCLMGSVLTPEKAWIVQEFGEPTFLLLDNDAAGDKGLFGTIMPDGGREANGAIEMLRMHVPVFVPEWPELDEPKLRKDHITWQHVAEDPDELTLHHVRQMIETTPLYAQSENSFDKTWGAW
jgi:hypothetical protein